LLIKKGEKARPVTEPRYIPLYTNARDLLLSETGIHLERMLFIAGMATPCQTIDIRKLIKYMQNRKTSSSAAT
jgi:hypothetical protein